MIDTDGYPDGPDDERLMHFSKEELRLVVYAYVSEIRTLKHASTHTDAYTLAEVKRLRKVIKDYDACLQNLWDNEMIPEDTDIWDEVKELLEVD